MIGPWIVSFFLSLWEAFGPRRFPRSGLKKFSLLLFLERVAKSAPEEREGCHSCHSKPFFHHFFRRRCHRQRTQRVVCCLLHWLCASLWELLVCASGWNFFPPNIPKISPRPNCQLGVWFGLFLTPHRDSVEVFLSLLQLLGFVWCACIAPSDLTSSKRYHQNRHWRECLWLLQIQIPNTHTRVVLIYKHKYMMMMTRGWLWLYGHNGDPIPTLSCQRPQQTDLPIFLLTTTMMMIFFLTTTMMMMLLILTTMMTMMVLILTTTTMMMILFLTTMMTLMLLILTLLLLSYQHRYSSCVVATPYPQQIWGGGKIIIRKTCHISKEWLKNNENQRKSCSQSVSLVTILKTISLSWCIGGQIIHRQMALNYLFKKNILSIGDTPCQLLSRYTILW